MRLEPLGNRVVVKKLIQEEKTKGGVIIPGNAKAEPTRGEVLAVGPGKLKADGTYQPCFVKPGQVVAFQQYAGATVEAGETYLILEHDDILALVHPK